MAVHSLEIKNNYSARISRTTTVLTISGILDKKIEVNDETIDLSIDKSIDLTLATLIETGSPVADSTYFCYISDSGNFEIGTTGFDSNGYRTGDTTRKFVCAISTDSSVQMKNDNYIRPINQEIVGPEIVLGTTITQTTGTAQYEDILTANLLVIPRTKVTYCIHFEQKLANQDMWVALDLDGVLVAEVNEADDSASARAIRYNYIDKYTTTKLISVTPKYYYNGGNYTHEVFANGASRAHIKMIASTLGEY